MLILLEITSIAIVALLVARLAPEPWRGRTLNALKGWVTIRAFWLLLTHPIAMEDGTKVIAWKLILETVSQIDAGTFWLFVFLAAGVKFVGILASMTRWLILLRGQQIRLPFRHIFGSFLIGRFIGTFLPSTAGLDGYKLYDASRFSGRTVETAAATFLEKILGVTGIFLTYLISLPFGIAVLEQFLGENTPLVAALSVLIVAAIIGGLLVILWFPGIVQWILATIPIPGKMRLEGIVMRLSNATAAYRHKKLLVLQALFLSFMVHFTTAAMYYFTTVAIGVHDAHFWQVTFGSSIQILATVLSPFTIAGEGIREAAQYLLLSNLIGAGPAIVSAALGFWAAEALTLLGGVFWWIRPKNYTPEFCLVDGEQVDYEAAAKAAVTVETEQERAAHDQRAHGELPPLTTRTVYCAGHGLAAGILAGILIGVVEALVIARGGFGEEAQVFWYGPFAYSLFLGGLGLLGGAALSVLPMDREDARGWVPSLGMIGTLVPLGLAITVFRVKRDVYMEQMPPAPVLLAIVAAAGAIALALFFFGPRLFRSSAGKRLAEPLSALGLLALVGVVGFAVAAFSSGAGPGEGHRGGIPAQLENRPNVILVMVDTLRADRLSCYGHDIETPNICSLADGSGSRFQGFAHASWTKPSAASLLSSLVPSTHNADLKPSTISPDVELVSEAFKAHGYTSGGIVSNINLSASFGFDQGFDEFHYLGPDYLAGAKESSSKLILYNIIRAVWFKIKPGLRFGDFYQNAEIVNDVAFDWLERHRGDRFFLFLHYMDPHDPYFEHPYNGNAVARVANPHPDPERTSELHRLYEGEIEFLDIHFGKLLDRLRELDLYENTIIALVSDHGEEFNEHGGFWHGLTLYDEQIHVPMLMKWARDTRPPPQSSLDELGRLIDISPTLLNAAGARVPAAMQGIDLMSEGGSRLEKDKEVFSEEDHEGNVLYSLRTKQWKYISSNAGNPRGLPPQELFDIANDPGETKNLAESQGRDTHEMDVRAQAARRFALGVAVEPSAEIEMSAEECEQLKNLGYLDPSTDCNAL